MKVLGGSKSVGRHTRTLLVAIAAIVILAAIPAVGSAPSQGSSGPPAEKGAGLRNGMMRDHVERKSRGEAGAPGVDAGNGKARVEVAHRLTEEALDAAVRSIGGTVVRQAPGLALAVLPEQKLATLEARDGIVEIHPPYQVSLVGDDEPSAQAMSGSKGGEATSKTRANAWHTAGYKGAGVKIGIVDSFNGTTWNNAAATGDLPSGPSGYFCMINGVGCASSFWNGGIHGVAVAEVVRDMAPSAQMYLATVNNVTDLRAAIDYFASKGVKILTRSLAAVYDGAGNGTGPMADAVNYAVSKGMTFFNSAGNSARNAAGVGGYWRATWADTDGDRWMNFSGGDELLRLTCQEGMTLGLRWSDWGTTRTDYDLYVYNTSGTLIASSRGNQGAGAAPLENMTSCNGSFDLAIWLYSSGNGTTGDTLEFMVNRGTVEYASSPYSATQPASDSASAGALSVGAVDPWNGTLIAGYSSQGPTNDGRMKPNLSAVSCVSSKTYSPNCFNGTSAATPAAAGAAALVLGRWPGTTPSSMKTWLMQYSVADRGVAGWDNVYGAGELILPTP